VRALRFFAAKNSLLGLKKAATNIGLAKNRPTEFIELLFAIMLQFRQKEQNLAGKRSINIGL